MTNVLLLGATGSLAQVAIPEFLQIPQVKLTLFARSAQRLPDYPRSKKIAGNIFAEETLVEAMQGQDLVIATLSGDLPAMAQSIVKAMHQTGVKRLIFVSSYGIYGEIAGRPGIPQILQPYRQAADIIEASGLDYTIVRPGWFDNSANTSYQVFLKGQTVTGNDISRKALAHFFKQIILTPNLYSQANCALVR
ncbi:NAD(P)-dependent oxidoreductase [Psittacicella melopsittaci]|uniref:NAD(P)-dependent oxidoreductase n=1 Tax=Psittacicella melopsittaci TaxID=2028576 RepID=A0A3A1Y8L1_9GAMM|nr:NAD(P)H-binding protein [Psittacicella melopsittaci]RIY33646.1 NAD(P)-dependent oxidoreductase [Psittacicella melopsittaci]